MKRRNRGEGSIFVRGDGRWCGQINLGWRNGRRARKLVYGRTAAEVRELMTKQLHDRDLGILPALGSSPTVERFLADWLKSIRSSLRIRSYERYEGIARTHLIPNIGRFRLDKLTPAHVQALLDNKLASGLAPRSVQGLRIVLGAALKQAVRWQMVVRNVAELVSGPKVQNREMQVLSPEQARRFLAACAGEPLHTLYLLALSTGLRRGELLALKWDDIDLEEGRLSVRRSLGRSSTQGIVIAEPKTPQGRRSVRLSEPIVAALRAHRRRQLEQRLSAGPEWRESGYIFTTSIGTTLDPRNLGIDFKRMLTKAKLPLIRFHDLRRSAATIALSQDVHPKIVSEMLGHSRISLTLDVYSHSLPNLQTEAGDKMAAALVGSAT
jgi:integrase